MSTLPKKFYQRDTVIVAKELLGKKLTRKIGNYEMSGTIIETEAYRHKDDPASHAFRNITDRNKVMFGEVGIAYVYFTYGMHYCFNVVAKKMKTPAGAVLIRGIIPEKGIKKMQENRNIENLKNLTNGPAKLTQALEITKEHYGIDLTKKTELYIEEGLEIKKIKKSTRIGIKDGKEMLWNFQIKNYFSIFFSLSSSTSSSEFSSNVQGANLTIILCQSNFKTKIITPVIAAAKIRNPI